MRARAPAWLIRLLFLSLLGVGWSGYVSAFVPVQPCPMMSVAAYPDAGVMADSRPSLLQEAHYANCLDCPACPVCTVVAISATNPVDGPRNRPQLITYSPSHRSDHLPGLELPPPRIS